MPEIWEIVGTWRSLLWADALPLAAACFVAGVMERRGELTLGKMCIRDRCRDALRSGQGMRGRP